VFGLAYALFEGIVFLLGMGTLLALLWVIFTLMHG
tara:strand:- start:298 stop:402 length:105 start_codon:yes stop_codon:yes gene_type:complete